MAHRAERYLPVEEAHLVANVVAVERTYQRSGFASEAEIKGFLCRYTTTRNSYLRQAYGKGKGDFTERMVNTKKDHSNDQELVLAASLWKRQGRFHRTDVVLRRREAATSAQIRLKRTSKIYETPIQGEVNAREQTKCICANVVCVVT